MLATSLDVENHFVKVDNSIRTRDYTLGRNRLSVLYQVLVFSALLIDSNNVQRRELYRPKMSNYPKQDPFQAMSLANGLRQKCSASILCVCQKLALHSPLFFLFFFSFNFDRYTLFSIVQLDYNDLSYRQKIEDKKNIFF